ncbi:MAG: 6,7-dimethyl-8-ribityllumazine synthase [bacterium]
MISVHSGNLDGSGLAFAIVASRFNGEIVERLVDGAVEAFTANKVDPADLSVWWVPGAFEIPSVCQALLRKRKVQAVVALGCVIRGETDHYQHVSAAAVRGIAQVSREFSTPIMFGVLTCDTMEQALARAGSGVDNHGYSGALAAIQTATLIKQL